MIGDYISPSLSLFGSIAEQEHLSTSPLFYRHEDNHSSVASSSSSIPRTSSDISGSKDVSGQDLVSTEDLMKFGILFNRLYRLLICMSCHEGHSLSSIHTHLKDSDGKRSVYANGEYKLYDVTFQHNATARNPPPNKQLQKLIVESLIDSQYISEWGDIRDAKTIVEWHQDPLPEIPTESK